jgi:hypothetical protein
LKTLDKTINTKVITNLILTLAEKVCDKMESKNNTVCPGAVTEMGVIILPVLTDLFLSPDYFCNMVKPVCNDVEYTVLNDTNYVNRVLSDKPDHI